MILVTGGAGFIGANFIYEWIEQESAPVINLDKLTYAGNRHNLKGLENNSQYTFVQGDILDRKLIQELLHRYQPKAVVHFAAETHVDRSIDDPDVFVQTNIMGTVHLLEECLNYWKKLDDRAKNDFHFLHMSTDEVYGTLKATDLSSKEKSPFDPSSPYAASKAASDHFVNAFHHTYGLPTLIAHSSNVFGPYQFPEKLIPLTIVNAIQGKPIPLYGDGLNIRSWIYVKDLCGALRYVLRSGSLGEAYNISEDMEKTNKNIVETICAILDQLHPNSSQSPYASLIQYITDRPGHDRRYSLNSNKIRNELGWQPKGDFESKLHQTVKWYLNNGEWLQKIMNGSYQNWIKDHYPHKQIVK